MSVKISDVMKKDAEKAFKGMDKRGEGKLKVADIPATLKQINQNVKGDFMESIEEDIDEEGTGFIGLEEFMFILQKKLQLDEDERELKEIFRVLDKEKKGEVNVNELRWILKSLGDDLTEEDIDDMIADVDTDGSGWVDYDEFSKLMLG